MTRTASSWAVAIQKSRSDRQLRSAWGPGITCCSGLPPGRSRWRRCQGRTGTTSACGAAPSGGSAGTSAPMSNTSPPSGADYPKHCELIA
jgi:hypothetical protein